MTFVKYLFLFIAKKMSVYFVESVVDTQLQEIEEIRRLYDLFDVSFND